jgi:superfamily II DNA helicase RecQ
MVATGVISCGYNYPSVRLVIHRGSFKSFVALHQELGQLARDGRLGISKVISSPKSRAETLHLNSSFVEPNVWIMDTENCRRHNLHLVVDGQSQRCSLIPAAQPCDTVYNNREWCRNNPRPPPLANDECTCHGAYFFRE